jgi:DNA-binding XRE family transcriptional regulator
MTIKELNSMSFKERAFLMALSTIGETLRELSHEDRKDIEELTALYLRTNDEEELESSARAMLEILEQMPVSVRVFVEPAPSASLASWNARLGKKIRDLRVEAGLTQEQLGEMSGLGQSHISRLELGQHSPNALTMEKIADALKVNLEAIAPTG